MAKQYGVYTTFEKPLTQQEVEFIKKINSMFEGVRMIYKEFNPMGYPDLPTANYSLGFKFNIPDDEDQ